MSPRFTVAIPTYNRKLDLIFFRRDNPDKISCDGPLTHQDVRKDPGRWAAYQEVRAKAIDRIIAAGRTKTPVEIPRAEIEAML